MKNTEVQHQAGEIDLRELFTTLWNGRLFILAITAIFSITGIAYSLLAPQEWSAKAIAVAPTPSEVNQLHFRLESLITLTKISSDFAKKFSEEKIFTDFIQAFNSFDNKCEFLKKNKYLPSVDIKNDGDPALQGFLLMTIKKISASQKKNEIISTLSFPGDNAQVARKRLVEYLNFIQTKEEVYKNQQLIDKITSQINSLTLIYQIQKVDTFKRLQEDIGRTELALRISKTAGIESPVENLNDESFFTIDLGAKALNEKLKILKEIKNPELLNPELANIRLQLDSLQAVPQEKVSFTSYHLLQSPSEPLSRDMPNRPFVVAMATIVGLMLGALVALSRSYWPRRG
ncbi:MAG: hypothetical protein JZU65_22710 [Chlorobium sp.]|nr:hypothetical protein [Chlorobium sp.]